MAVRVETSTCPDCGMKLQDEPWSTGLCPRCLLGLAVSGDSPEAPTLDYSAAALAAGRVLGNRYQIRSLLGRGGMGEVWRAFDLKLRVDVALKTLRPQLVEEERALEALRSEVRTAREVISPNVCRVFDLVELDGQELVSMEYIDGITLADILKMRAPLELTEAREIGSQLLAGLEAIHAAGLVHRDMKPENIMMTRSGRVVVMDFGIAKGLADAKTGTVSGTPAYMAPEQARGEPVSQRADVFSAAVVLAEMIAPGGMATHEARAAVWKGIHHEPPQLPESPWAPVLRRAVSRAAEQRFASAAALARALEEVTLRVEGAEDIKPYPGLASFTREDAEYFFGRELEVEEMWKKLQRPHLLGLIGPSGAGKSSFLHAGLLPVIPTGWRAVMAAPGSQPFIGLARALAKELAGDEEAVQDLMQFETLDVAVSVVARWRRQHDEVLIAIDQFEELFTQNTAEVQTRFCELLGGLALDADAHVLISMRDDFLFYCSGQPALSPMFSELTPLRPPSGTALRRAIVQPALKCGYRFEDEALVGEMVDEVSQERGALPMLAFAAARLWDHRDREQGKLTREAYEHIGGVGGALAQHAEQTLEQIGQDHIPIVREIFRNLVTAQGTRAARDRDDLLSVFSQGDEAAAPARGFEPPGREPRRAKAPGLSGGPGDREGAEEVLDTLINARLLTSYEVPAADEGEPAHHRVEIIHESLLSNWPRLVHWQAQDEEGALLRDQLRQAAQMWEERGKPEDLLWTGTSFKEYELWRDRYRGGISSAEEEFAAAMVGKAERNRRRRQIVLTGAFTILIVVLGVIATLWWRGEVARQQAVTEARRAEASKLLALGRLEIDANPTAALAYAMASLELSDDETTRRFALEALWKGPPAFVLTEQWTWNALFSPDGQWLAAGGNAEYLRIWPRQGGEALSLAGKRSVPLGFSSDSRLLITQQKRFEDTLRTWSVESGELLRTQQMEGEIASWAAYLMTEDQRVLTIQVPPEWDRVLWHDWPLLEGEMRLRAEDIVDFYWLAGCTDPAGRWLGFSPGTTIFALPLSEASVDNARPLGEHDNTFTGCAIDAERGRLASIDEGGEIRIWNLESPSAEPLQTLLVGEPVGSRAMAFSPDGRRFVAGNTDQLTRIWDLEGPPGADPLILARGEIDFVLNLNMHPGGTWLVTAESKGTVLWPLQEQRSYSLQGHTDGVSDLDFTPDGRWLFSVSWDRTAWRWPLEGSVAQKAEMLDRSASPLELVKFDPSGLRVAVASSDGGPFVHSLENGEELWLQGLSFNPWALAWDQTGRWVASGGGHAEPADALIRLWDLEESEVKSGPEGGRYIETTITLDAGDAKPVSNVAFLPNGELLSIGFAGLRRWSIADRTFEQLSEEPGMRLALTPDRRTAVVRHGSTGTGGGPIVVFDLVERTSHELPAHGERPVAIALDPTGQILVSGDEEGVVRVSRLDGSEAHLLLGHTGSIQTIAVSPDGRWIASGSADKSIRLWPMPDLSRPPLQSLPVDDLLAKLGSLTNLRAVEDPDSDTGWSIEIGPFRGWEEVPTW